MEFATKNQVNPAVADTVIVRLLAINADALAAGNVTADSPFIVPELNVPLPVDVVLDP